MTRNQDNVNQQESKKNRKQLCCSVFAVIALALALILGVSSAVVSTRDCCGAEWEDQSMVESAALQVLEQAKEVRLAGMGEVDAQCNVRIVTVEEGADAPTLTALEAVFGQGAVLNEVCYRASFEDEVKCGHGAECDLAEADESAGENAVAAVTNATAQGNKVADTIPATVSPVFGDFTIQGCRIGTTTTTPAPTSSTTPAPTSSTTPAPTSSTTPAPTDSTSSEPSVPSAPESVSEPSVPTVPEPTISFALNSTASTSNKLFCPSPATSVGTMIDNSLSVQGNGIVSNTTITSVAQIDAGTDFGMLEITLSKEAQVQAAGAQVNITFVGPLATGATRPLDAVNATVTSHKLAATNAVAKLTALQTVVQAKVDEAKAQKAKMDKDYNGTIAIDSQTGNEQECDQELGNGCMTSDDKAKFTAAIQSWGNVKGKVTNALEAANADVTNIDEVIQKISIAKAKYAGIDITLDTAVTAMNDSLVALKSLLAKVYSAATETESADSMSAIAGSAASAMDITNFEKLVGYAQKDLLVAGETYGQEIEEKARGIWVAEAKTCLNDEQRKQFDGLAQDSRNFGESLFNNSSNMHKEKTQCYTRNVTASVVACLAGLCLMMGVFSCVVYMCGCCDREDSEEEKFQREMKTYQTQQALNIPSGYSSTKKKSKSSSPKSNNGSNWDKQSNFTVVSSVPASQFTTTRQHPVFAHPQSHFTTTQQPIQSQRYIVPVSSQAPVMSTYGAQQHYLSPVPVSSSPISVTSPSSRQFFTTPARV